MTQDSSHSQSENDIFSEFAPGSEPLPEDYQRESDQLIAEYRARQEAGLVQMIATRPYEDQGLVEYAGDPVDAQEWLDAVADGYDATVMFRGVRGWEDYSATIRLVDIDYPDASATYYLVTDAALKALGLEV
jgi:hypothetical protein